MSTRGFERNLQYPIDWQGMVECPVLDDAVISASVAIADTADTDSVIAAARVGLDLKRTAVCAGTHRMVSGLHTIEIKTVSPAT